MYTQLRTEKYLTLLHRGKYMQYNPNLLGLFDPEDNGNIYLRNIGNYLPVDIQALQILAPLLWEP